MDLQLQPFNRAHGPITVTVDPARGRITGPDADLVRYLVDSARRDGYIVTHPYPTSYPVTDPARDLGELALVLGQYWILPEALAEVRPAPPPDDAPPGAVY